MAKLRAARLLCGTSSCSAFQPTKATRASALRTHCQTSGWSLTAQDPFIATSSARAIEAMAATSSGPHAEPPHELTRRSPRASDRLLARASPVIRSSCSSSSSRHDRARSSIRGAAAISSMESLTHDLADARAAPIIEEVEGHRRNGQGRSQSWLCRSSEDRGERPPETQARIDSGRRKPLSASIKLQAPRGSASIDSRSSKVDNAHAVRVKRRSSGCTSVEGEKRDPIQSRGRPSTRSPRAPRPGKKGNLLELAINADARCGRRSARVSDGAREAACSAAIKPRSAPGLRASMLARPTASAARLRQAQDSRDRTEVVPSSATAAGPASSIAKMGQDGHDRGAEGRSPPRSPTSASTSTSARSSRPPEETARRQAVENDVPRRSVQARRSRRGIKTLMPAALRAALAALGAA